ncbi:Met1 [Kluyveromyces lactis]|nr:Met1 [Kluyveromyces lactis]
MSGKLNHRGIILPMSVQKESRFIEKRFTPLITSLKSIGEQYLLIGTHSINVTQSRISSILDSGASCVVIHSGKNSDLKQLSQKFYGNNDVVLLDREFQLSDLTTLGRVDVGKIVDRVFVNLDSKQSLLIRDIFEQCQKLRIPINTHQRPEYSTFSICSTYNDPGQSGLQIAITTNGQGCLLANRIKREIVSRLPQNISKVVRNMGHLRERIIYEDHNQIIHSHFLNKDLQDLGFGIDEDVWESHKLNKLVYEFNVSEKQLKMKRSRWLSQIMEYYPLQSLAELSVDQLADQYHQISQGDDSKENVSKRQRNTPDKKPSNVNDADVQVSTTSSTILDVPKKGSISLVGSGPGSVSMLTIGALHEIKTADLILADKLVPEKVLQLIPQGTETFIARKFPGNAERAQEELLEKGFEGLQKGLKVVRLKQGDPYIFGRGGEEFLFFKDKGYTPLVLPGLSSALAATVVSNIPATQRDVADQVLICTGTGRKGALPNIPEYVETRTTVFLMSLHRAQVLIDALLEKGWDENVPAAIVERASCPDQRITRTLLKNIPQTVEEIGSRPPGLLVVGNAINVLTDPELLKFDASNAYHIEEGYEHVGFEDNVQKLLNI